MNIIPFLKVARAVKSHKLAKLAEKNKYIDSSINKFRSDLEEHFNNNIENLLMQDNPELVITSSISHDVSSEIIKKEIENFRKNISEYGPKEIDYKLTTLNEKDANINIRVKLSLIELNDIDKIDEIDEK